MYQVIRKPKLFLKSEHTTYFKGVRMTRQTTFLDQGTRAADTQRGGVTCSDAPVVAALGKIPGHRLTLDVSARRASSYASTSVNTLMRTGPHGVLVWAGPAEAPTAAGGRGASPPAAGLTPPQRACA